MNARNVRATGLSLAAAVATAVWMIGATNTPSVAQSNVPSAVQPAGDAAASTAPAPPATPTAEPSAEPARTYERAARTKSAPAAPADVQPAQPTATVAIPGGPANVYYSPGGFGYAQITGPETDEQRRLREESTRLELELGNLLKEHAAAADEAKAALRPRIQENLVSQFDARQKGRDLEIADLEAQVERLRDLHQRREAAKAEIVNARLAQLLRSAEGLGWDGNDSTGWDEAQSTSPHYRDFAMPGRRPAAVRGR